MASHHHHDGGCRHRHHNYHETIQFAPANYATTSPCCCGDSRLCCTQSNHSSPPSVDHLLRLIASYLQNQQQDTQCSCEIPSQRFNGVRRHSFVKHPHQKKNVQREYDNLLLSCLLRKIEHLDLSLNRRDSHSTTLRDSAARVIQTHFRSYLVRRSISLRQLKELATIKSSFFSLKSSVSGKTHFPFVAVSGEATDLLLQLDSIQGRVDPMIRDGKRLLIRDLVRFLQYIDGCAVKRRDIVCKSAKDRSFRAKRHVGEDSFSEKSRKQQMGTIYVTTNGDEESIAELEEFHFMTDDGQEIPIVSVESSTKIGSSKSKVGALVKVNKAKTQDKNRKNLYERASSAEDDSFEDTVSCDDGVGSNSRTRSRSGVVVKGSGAKARVMKTVSFDEDGNVYKVYGDTPEASVSGGDESSASGSNNENGDDYNEVEDIKYVPKEGSEEEEEVHSENEEESPSEKAQVIENVTHMGINERKREFQLQKGSSMFSPPLPLKMEP